MRKTTSVIIAAAIAVTASACGSNDTAKPASPALPSVDMSVAPMKANTAIWANDPAIQNVKRQTEKLVTGRGIQLGITGYGIVDAVTEQLTEDNGNGSTHADAPVRAANGQKLLVFTYEADGQLNNDPTIDKEKSGADVTVVADGTRIPLTAKSLRFNGVTGTANTASAGIQEATAVSIPAGAKDIHLEIVTGNVTQTVSLIDGHVAGTAPTLWKRQDVGLEEFHGEPTVENALSPQPELDFDYTTTGFYSTTALVFTRAELTTTEFGNEEHSTPVTASGPDKALLIVGGNGQDTNPTATGHGTLPASAFVLTLPDGTKITGKRNGTNTFQQDLLGGQIYFEVPATFSAGTLDITAGKVTADTGDTLDYKGVTKTLPITVSATD